MIKVIANHLKKCYLTWNRESVSDDVIATHLLELSNDQISLSDDIHLQNTNHLLNLTKKVSGINDNVNDNPYHTNFINNNPNNVSINNRKGKRPRLNK